MLLRGAASPVNARMVWPATSLTRPPLVVVFLTGDADPASSTLPTTLSVRLGALVLACSGSTPFHDAVRAWEWAADHAPELGADPEQLVVAGQAEGCLLAAAVAVHARDQGWPPLARQILIRPLEEFPLAGSMSGVAPVTFVGAGPRLADRFRDAGVEIEELQHEEQL
jgi:hypothetical protein